MKQAEVAELDQPIQLVGWNDLILNKWDLIHSI